MKRFKQGDSKPAGTWNTYRKRTIVPMLGPMREPFMCESREGQMEGQPGDFVVEDGHGGYYPISAEFHAKNYEPADPEKES